jgi:exopolyphosphatase/pppGpp-phosphohydrolase
MKAITSSEVIARVREALEMKGETIAREEEATWATP